MLKRGAYPAAVTPFTQDGKVDMPSVARLLAFFEAKGCTGAVLAGTNGEGPSLSAVEKRDLIKAAIPLKGDLDLILGIATSSLDEARWLCEQGAKAGAAAALVMPPSYFKEASEEGITAWFTALLDSSPLPILIYNFPQKTSINLRSECLKTLAAHPQMAGVKDSSGEVQNILDFKEAVGPKALFMGNETLLYQALEAGWTGTISGAANVIPQWLSEIVFTYGTKAAKVRFDLILPVLETLRKSPQPATNKALLHNYGIITNPDVRLPLQQIPQEAFKAVQDALQNRLGTPA